MENASGKPMFNIIGLKKYFSVSGSLGRKNTVRAVDGVSFDIKKGETFGLVGESGCGKTTLGRTITRLYDVTEGRIFFEGKDIAPLKGRELTPYKQRIQIIFQDPYSSLDPYMDVEHILSEPLCLHEKLGKAEKHEKIREMLYRVGLNESDMEKYPHEFSGGQRQRIGVARALITRPAFVLCDEPISALDVSIQAQVVNLLEDLQSELGLTYLFVAHDLSMVRHISQRIGVMYMGRMAEISPSKELYKNPLHPYTRALLSAIPIPNPERARKSRRILLSGDVPSLQKKIEGCPFASRCPLVLPKCREEIPALTEVSPGHQAACFRL